MMTMVAILIFGSALALSAYAMAVTITPHMDRIIDLLAGRLQPRFTPLAMLVHAERRIAVRRRAAPASGSYRPREAA